MSRRSWTKASRGSAAPSASFDLARAQRRLTVLLGLAVAVSIVHYTDNVGAYDAYPRSTTVPNPSAAVIAASWFAFTAFGIAGFVLLRRARTTAAAFCLAVYSGSGLVGIAHYAVGGTGGFPWWRHAHIVADIALGLAMLAFALQLAGRSSTRPAT